MQKFATSKHPESGERKEEEIRSEEKRDRLMPIPISERGRLPRGEFLELREKVTWEGEDG